MQHTAKRALRQKQWRLIQYSFLMLFVELTLIRFTSASFMYLAFFSNFILMASFLGIAAGFLRAEKSFNLFQLAPVILAVLIYLCHRYHFEYQINLDTTIDDLNYDIPALSKHALPIIMTLPGIFIAVTLLMAAFANGTAEAFRSLPPLPAYRLEILGSLFGILTFTLLSFLQATPLVWGLCICLVYLSLQWHSWRFTSALWLIQLGALTCMLAVFISESTAAGHLWSPYYKIAVKPYSHGRFAIDVNGAPQQFIESVKQKHLYKPFYFMPYQHFVKPHALAKVLVIGAGTGGDVAVALAQGAKQVDAVEIDPTLMTLGKTLHPDTPYSDPRVSLFVNDGRAFLEQSQTKYDLIILALTDSMTLVTHQSSLRLENYLLTQEGLQAARAHLTPQGMFTMYNYYRNAWIVDRLGVSLQQVFGSAPCLETQGKQQHWLSVFTINNDHSALRCATPWQANSAALPVPASDDRPFFYMQANELTTMYILSLLFILAVTAGTLKLSGSSPRQIRQHADVFLMGTAFLLLESKNVINFALLFGTTWLVNSLVFIGILATVYLAALLTERMPVMRRDLLFALLLLSLAICWLIPNHALLNLPAPLRLLLASMLAFSPVFFANLIFAARFRRTAHATHAFAMNSMGAMVGALLEYSSLVIGYQNILLLAAVLYTLAVLIMLRRQPKIIPTTKNSGADTYSWTSPTGDMAPTASRAASSSTPVPLDFTTRASVT